MDKFGVDDALLEPLLHDFDTRVAPWARGEVSRDGLCYDDFLQMLDEEDRQADRSPGAAGDKKALLRQKKSTRQRPAATPRKPKSETVLARMSAMGFLIGKARWSERTLSNRRAFVIAIAKALYVSTDVLLETVEELTDPEYMEEALAFLSESNAGAHPSSYLGTGAKAVRKIARDFLCRPDRDIEEFDALVAAYSHAHRGISPRNKVKLRRFDADRIQKMIDLTDLIVGDVNARVSGTGKKDEDLPIEAVRDVMAALAHAILLEKAPRSANVIGARLDWISFRSDRARITIPAAEIKMRDAAEGEMVVPLGIHTSRLMQAYLDTVRSHAIMPGDDRNPFLFPSQDASGRSHGQPYTGLLQRLVRLVRRHVGERIHPHLYRHLLGWIWLKDSLDHLPKVQRLLGHKRLQTTIDYYAEIDATLALQEWQDKIERKRSRVQSLNAPRRRRAA